MSIIDGRRSIGGCEGVVWAVGFSLESGKSSPDRPDLESLPSGTRAPDIVDTRDGDCRLSRQAKLKLKLLWLKLEGEKVFVCWR